MGATLFDVEYPGSSNFYANRMTSLQTAANKGTRQAGAYGATNRDGTMSVDPASIRAGATENLSTLMSGDPSGGYSAKMQQLMNGEFDSSDPSYQWRFNQGQQAVERSAAARGLLGSGNAAIELQQYGQGAASQEYGAQFARVAQAMGLEENAFQSSYGRLAELAGMNTGLQSSQTSASVAMNQLAQRKNEVNMQQENANNTDAAFMQAIQGNGVSAWQRSQLSGGNQSGYSSTNAYAGGTAPIDMMSGYSSGGVGGGDGGSSWGNVSNSSGTVVAAWGE